MLLPRVASGQSYPTRPVRVIVPFAPAGPTDVFARLLAQEMSEHFGRQFYVENLPGAGGNVGTGRAARAAPDGYTVLIVSSSYAVSPALFERVPYDPARDFDAVTLAVTTPMILTVNPTLRGQSVKDLVALIKANPGKFSFASGGTGSPGHLVGEQLRLSLSLDLVHVPFNSAGLRSARLSRAIRRLPSSRRRLPYRKSKTARCALWRRWARHACRLCRTFPPLRKLAIRILRPKTGSLSLSQPERQGRSSCCSI